MHNIIWLKNPKILLEYPLEFYPLPNMSKERKCNALVRLFIYYICIIYLLNYDVKWIKFSIIGIIASTIMGSYNKSINTKSYNHNDNPILLNQDLNNCRKSTIDNPMGNPLITDANLDQKACNHTPEEIKDNIKFNVYEDVNNTKVSNLLYRTFYTTPVSNYPNDINKFSTYLYGQNDSATCKLGAEGCEPFRDERYTSLNYEK